MRTIRYCPWRNRSRREAKGEEKLFSPEAISRQCGCYRHSGGASEPADHDGSYRFYGITITSMLTVAALFSGLALFAPEFVMRVYTDKESFRKERSP